MAKAGRKQRSSFTKDGAETEARNMIDAHVHLERGPYTIEWIYEFVKTARSRGIDEIWLLEHCYRFTEFVPMYDSIRADSPYLDQ